jgi:hypothetical protein
MALLVLMSALTSCAAPASRGARELMLGSWELQSRTVARAEGGTIADPVLGAQPIGRLFYDASGHMALQMMRQGRTGAISSPETSDGARSARVVLGYDAYFGTFTVDETAGTVTHHVESSLFPAPLPRRPRYLRVELHVTVGGRQRDHAHTRVSPLAVSW